MRFKAIAITALFVLFGCHSAPTVTDDSSYVEFKQKDIQIRQECINAGHADQSKTFFDCIKARWASNQKAISGSSSTDTANQDSPGFEQDKQRWTKALQRCNSLFFAKKLKTNYERGQCMDNAHEKYLSSYFVNKSAFNEWRTDALLIMVQLDKKKISTDEAGVLAQRSMNKLADAENTTLVQIRQQEAAQTQQQRQYQMQQQQQQSAAQSTAMMGFLGAVQDTIRRNQAPVYIPPPPPMYSSPSIRCNTLAGTGTTTCYQNR